MNTKHLNKRIMLSFTHSLIMAPSDLELIWDIKPKYPYIEHIIPYGPTGGCDYKSETDYFLFSLKRLFIKSQNQEPL